MNEIKEYVTSKGMPLPNVIITGDFNFLQIEWKTGIIATGGKSASERRAAQLLCECNDRL